MPESRIWGGTIRKLWFTETEKFRDHMLRLDTESREMRFGTRVSDDFINEYAAHAMELESVVFGFFADGEMHAAAELRFLGDDRAGEAEAAFSVEQKYQDSGVGTELLGRLILTARNRGVKRLYMNCLASNRKMQHVAQKYEAELVFDCSDVIGRLRPTIPTPLSLWSEAFSDGSGLAMAVFEFPLHLANSMNTHSLP
jgi:RimJ/RimL family protein N-acetyltransferase